MQYVQYVCTQHVCIVSLRCHTSAQANYNNMFCYKKAPLVPRSTRIKGMLATRSVLYTVC